MKDRKEDLEARVREMPLSDRLKDVGRRIGRMCSEGRPPKMRIPVTADDDDCSMAETKTAGQVFEEAFIGRLEELEEESAARSRRHPAQHSHDGRVLTAQGRHHFDVFIATTVSDAQAALDEKEAVVERLLAVIQKRDTAIALHDREIAEKDARIAELTACSRESAEIMRRARDRRDFWKARAEEAEAVLRFYAETKQGTTSGGIEVTTNWMDGGKRARAHLASIKEENPDE